MFFRSFIYFCLIALYLSSLPIKVASQTTFSGFYGCLNTTRDQAFFASKELSFRDYVMKVSEPTVITKVVDQSDRSGALVSSNSSYGFIFLIEDINRDSKLPEGSYFQISLTPKTSSVSTSVSTTFQRVGNSFTQSTTHPSITSFTQDPSLCTISPSPASPSPTPTSSPTPTLSPSPLPTTTPLPVVSLPSTCTAVTSIQTALGRIPTTPDCLASWVIARAVEIVGGLAFLRLFYGGFKFITAKGSPESIQEGKELIVSAVSGLLFVVFSVVILQTVGVDVLGLPGFQRAGSSIILP